MLLEFQASVAFSVWIFPGALGRKSVWRVQIRGNESLYTFLSVGTWG